MMFCPLNVPKCHSPETSELQRVGADSTFVEVRLSGMDRLQPDASLNAARDMSANPDRPIVEAYMHSALASQNRSLGRYVLWGRKTFVDHPSRKARIEAARHGVFPHGISPDESANFELGFSLGFERAHHSDLKIA